MLDTNTLHTTKRSFGFSNFNHPRSNPAHIMKPKTYRTDSSRRTRVWILDLRRAQEADEETEKGHLLQPTKGKDYKGTYTGAHSLTK